MNTKQQTLPRRDFLGHGGKLALSALAREGEVEVKHPSDHRGQRLHSRACMVSITCCGAILQR